MKATVSVTIGKHTAFNVVYDVVRTRAPIAYDYGYVLRLGDLDMGDERIVAIPEQYTEYQSNRYASGLFSPAPVEDMSEEDVLDSITSKLFRE
jgi:hypothetical protein